MVPRSEKQLHDVTQPYPAMESQNIFKLGDEFAGEDFEQTCEHLKTPRESLIVKNHRAMKRNAEFRPRSNQTGRASFP